MNPAEGVPLGKTRLTVTRLGLGTAPLGGLFQVVEDAAAHAAVTRAYEVGMRLFDTAPLYGHGLAVGVVKREAVVAQVSDQAAIRRNRHHVQRPRLITEIRGG